MTDKPFEFEKALKELEDITTWFESTDVDLDQGLDKFERGMELASQLKAHLVTVENRVEKIKQRFSATTTGETAQPGPDSQAGLFGA
ncbi:MAG: Exodeoxyribonuclease 7 small subunit [Patescibacteria group bacterium]|nr:Exodeoxyribonuclease 7 small subunit [Patescibacteria group bacterium]